VRSALLLGGSRLAEADFGGEGAARMRPSAAAPTGGVRAGGAAGGAAPGARRRWGGGAAGAAGLFYPLSEPQALLREKPGTDWGRSAPDREGLPAVPGFC